MKKRMIFPLLLTIALCLFAPNASADTLTLPASLNEIHTEAFYGAASLDEVIVPDGATIIGERAFAGSSLKAITIPMSVTQIAEDAFDGCEGMTISGYMGSYAQAYAGEHGFAFNLLATPEAYFQYYGDSSCGIAITGYTGSHKDIVIPSEIGGVPVTSIDYSAFRDQSSITSVIIPEGVTSISRYAFYNCANLTQVVIPDSVIHLGEKIF